MQYIELVAILAVTQLIFFAMATGAARAKSGIKAPAISGDEKYERAYRVQLNTVELIIPFLVALYLSAQYWSTLVVAGIGAIYLVGRMIYWRAYMKEPTSRALGFGLSMFPTLILILMALVGVIKGFF
jgi:uncharacterized membrane protein YecN with MAPEG domain